MSKPGEVMVGVLARVRALLQADWRGRAGERFRAATNAMSDFAKDTLEDAGLPPPELPSLAVSLVVDKIAGVAQKEKAAAIRDFTEAEEHKIEVQLKARSLESEVRKRQAEARLAQINAAKAEIELISSLRENHVVVLRDDEGNYRVIPVPEDFDFDGLYRRLFRSSTEKQIDMEKDNEAGSR